MAQRSIYIKKFKMKAVRLFLEGSRTVSEVECDLESSRNLVSRWVKESQENPEISFSGHEKLKETEQALHNLTKELECVSRGKGII